MNVIVCELCRKDIEDLEDDWFATVDGEYKACCKCSQEYNRERLSE